MAYTALQLFHLLSKDLLPVIGFQTRGNLTVAGIAHNAQVKYLQRLAEEEGAAPLNMDARVAELIELTTDWMTTSMAIDNDQDMDKDPLNQRRAHHNLAVERMQIEWP
jgi:hypothetical protein